MFADMTNVTLGVTGSFRGFQGCTLTPNMYPYQCSFPMASNVSVTAHFCGGG
jgi:hypothetical protein